MKLDKAQFKNNVVSKLKERAGKTLENATKREIFEAVSYAAMDTVLENWIATKATYEKEDVKQAYYLSAEFLMGRAFGNNLVNLVMQDDVREVVAELGFDLNEIEDLESDAGLGNGGLGRLAACFLDSLATLELPGHGYGIRYKYGMFEQKIENGFQVEYADKWLTYDEPWTIKRVDEAVFVKLGGHVVIEKDSSGREHFNVINSEVVKAIPFDVPVIGFDTKTVNTLRLWEAQAAEEFDLQLFNDQKYLQAVEKGNIAEDISRVLYPNDSGPSGKALRLKQQYFFVSASIQDAVRKFKAKHGNNFAIFHEKVAFQLNDTHPVVAIPELMRILVDEEKMEWESAWAITSKTCAYTNHTILAEALEKWPIDLFSGLLPRIYQIVEEINRRFMAELRDKYPGDWARHHKMSIIADGMVKMAWLAIVGGHKVNGVAALHTEILKNIELKEWYELYPEKFLNKTNGVTQRRWLLKSNPELAKLLDEKIGSGWKKELSELKKLEKFLGDDEVAARLSAIKKSNKVRLAKYIKEHNGVDIDVDSIFDIQIKRLHEYKRQLLAVLNIMALYNRVKANPAIEMVPRTFVFGAKAASGYRRAKLIIKLINNIANKVNNDASINGKLKVVFVENYRVSVAEKLFPAADISEQISTAGKEASGTGNMKFMINGAMTIGTLDGANVEIAEEVGNANAFIFGLTAEEVEELNKNNSYNPWNEYHNNPELKKVIDQLVDGTYSPDNRELFREIYDSLMHGVEGNKADQYYVLKDFAAYSKAQDQVNEAYKDQKAWVKMMLINIANSGKFSSDRTIQEYADQIWNIKKTNVK